MILCICNVITESDVKQAVACGYKTPKKVMHYCGKSFQCGSCKLYIKEAIEKALKDSK